MESVRRVLIMSEAPKQVNIDVDAFNKALKTREVIMERTIHDIWEEYASRVTNIKEYKRKRKDGLRRFYVRYNEFHQHHYSSMDCCTDGGNLNTYSGETKPLTFDEILEQFTIYTKSNNAYVKS